MHPRRSAQYVLLCDLCETVHIQSHCEYCNTYLCINCVGKHLSDSSKKHNVMPYEQRKFTPAYPKCPKHTEKHCELFCEKCDVPVCSTCVSNKHSGHHLSDVKKIINSKAKDIQKDLEELETRIYPRYEEMASDVQTMKMQLETNYRKMTRADDQRGDQNRKYDIQEIKNKPMAILEEHTDEISHRITKLRQIIQDLKKILDSNDVFLTATYESRNSEFRTLPPKVRITSPSFSPQKINKDQLNEMFGSLSPLSINTEHGDTMKSAEAVSSPPVIPLLDEPRLTAAIDTEYRPLYSVTCLSDKEIWTHGYDGTMKLVNLHGKLLKTIQTVSANAPQDIALKLDGKLVYTDPDNVYTDHEARTINIVRNEQKQTVIKLQGWGPLYVCSTSSDDLLVTMVSDDVTQSKVVRYSGFNETQIIQFDDRDRPLYSCGYLKFITENRNLDICVADSGSKAVVVVNQSGKLRFRYTGHPSNTKQSFYPVGITTDSQSHILIADYGNHRIHILDQDGEFLRYIENCGLVWPWGLCVDTRDNLFVVDNENKVKKIQYTSLS